MKHFSQNDLKAKIFNSGAIMPLYTKRTHLKFQNKAVKGRSTGSYFTDISVNRLKLTDISVKKEPVERPL